MRDEKEHSRCALQMQFEPRCGGDFGKRQDRDCCPHILCFGPAAACAKPQVVTLCSLNVLIESASTALPS